MFGRTASWVGRRVGGGITCRCWMDRFVAIDQYSTIRRQQREKRGLYASHIATGTKADMCGRRGKREVTSHLPCRSRRSVKVRLRHTLGRIPRVFIVEPPSQEYIEENETTEAGHDIVSLGSISRPAQVRGCWQPEDDMKASCGGAIGWNNDMGGVAEGRRDVVVGPRSSEDQVKDRTDKVIEWYVYTPLCNM